MNRRCLPHLPHYLRVRREVLMVGQTVVVKGEWLPDQTYYGIHRLLLLSTPFASAIAHDALRWKFRQQSVVGRGAWSDGVVY